MRMNETKRSSFMNLAGDALNLKTIHVFTVISVNSVKIGTILIINQFFVKCEYFSWIHEILCALCAFNAMLLFSSEKL